MGGGLLETNNQLERFNKNKRSKKLMYSILGILLLVGSLTLFKTFSFFEEKRDFNVLRGRVPEFNRNDVTLAVILDGQEVEKYPSSGKYKVNVTCDNGANGSWDYETWSLNVANLNSKKVKCQIDFKTEFLYDDVKIGDYVSYTPTLKSLDITNDLTGMSNYSGDGETEMAIKEAGKQTILTEYNVIWRVIRKIMMEVLI